VLIDGVSYADKAEFYASAVDALKSVLGVRNVYNYELSLIGWCHNGG